MQVRRIISALTISAFLSSGVAFAQDRHDDEHHDNHSYVEHHEWHRGARIGHDDWNRGQQVDWRAQHLQAPRRGYEWREVDGNFVLAAVATGLIANAIVNAHR